MSGCIEAEPWRPFKLQLTYTDAELAAYHRVLVQAQRRFRTSRYEWSVWATGIGAAMAGTWLLHGGGALAEDGQAAAAALLFGVFSVGVWTPSLWSGPARKRYWQAWRGQAEFGTLLVTPRGIAMRRRGIRSYYAGSAIGAVTQEGGMMLLWNEGGFPIVAVPTRLLDQAQRDALLSFVGKSAH